MPAAVWVARHSWLSTGCAWPLSQDISIPPRSLQVPRWSAVQSLWCFIRGSAGLEDRDFSFSIIHLFTHCTAPVFSVLQCSCTSCSFASLSQFLTLPLQFSRSTPSGVNNSKVPFVLVRVLVQLTPGGVSLKIWGKGNTVGRIQTRIDPLQARCSQPLGARCTSQHGETRTSSKF